MRTCIQLIRGLFVGLLTCGAATAAQASDTLTVAPQFVHFDEARHLVLVNRQLSALGLNGTEQKRYLVAGSRVLTFSQPVAHIGTDTGYTATAGTGQYRLFFTELPVVHLDTRHTIVDEPSVYGQFSLTEAGGTRVQSALGVEYRGASSQVYPKKSFELSFWADTTGATDRDVTLLGMRTDNKYNLQALYTEPLRFRSKVANELWQEVHQIYYQAQEPAAKNGIAMQYAEVFVNGEYRGVYALTERVDRKQLKLKKYANNEITGELYKGYDWSGGACTFDYAPPFDNASEEWGGFEYKHPEERIDWSNIYNFVSFVTTSTDADFMASYRQKFHLGNAVDYYLFMNLARAIDNTGKNLYIARYKKNEPYYYVPWDLDGVFGTDWQGGRTGSIDDLQTNGLYRRLNQDCSAGGFRETLATRWNQLRGTVLTHSHIMAKFRANYQYLTANNVYAREELAWSAFRTDTTQLAYIDAWLTERLNFLDGQFNQSCSGVLASTSSTAQPALRLYPNPAQDYVQVDATTPLAVTVCDLHGRVVLETRLSGSQSRLPLQQLAKGLYLVMLRSSRQVQTQKLVVQ